jgi:hypothetical protein
LESYASAIDESHENQNADADRSAPSHHPDKTIKGLLLGRGVHFAMLMVGHVKFSVFALLRW